MIARIAGFMIVAAAVPAFAQDSTTAPASLLYRRGQWAAHFNLGSFGGVGVSRFSSPTRAKVLLLNVTILHREQVVDDPFGGQVTSITSGAGVSARFGWRTYRAGTGPVTPYVTLGPTFTLSHSHFSGSGGSQNANGWALGVFGDLGALYHVTSNLALSAAANGGLSYSRSVQTSTTGAEGSAWDIVLSGVTVSAGLTLLF